MGCGRQGQIWDDGDVDGNSGDSGGLDALLCSFCHIINVKERIGRSIKLLLQLVIRELFPNNAPVEMTARSIFLYHTQQPHK